MNSIRPFFPTPLDNISVSSIYRLGIHANLGPRLTNAVIADL
jgi:hypothetical protein